jgi:NAD(P)-dependent dehydrogenase (short-subunit alcohol dehydrogenase family)
VRLEGKVAIVTGSSKGIGEGCARVFAREGARVVVTSRNEREGAAVAAGISASGGTAFALAVDVSDSRQVRQMLETTLSRFGRLDILVNNAGQHLPKNVEKTSEEEWDHIIDTNLKSVFLCSKYAIPHLRKTRGCIVNMSSMVGVVGQGNSGAYSATKGGIIAMTKGMALDFAPDGIRVNCICPGWIETPLVNYWFAQQENEAESRKYIHSVHPLGRIGTIEECGEAALFLASDSSSFITGTVLAIDGGVTLGY